MRTLSLILLASVLGVLLHVADLALTSSSPAPVAHVAAPTTAPRAMTGPERVLAQAQARQREVEAYGATTAQRYAPVAVPTETTETTSRSTGHGTGRARSSGTCYEDQPCWDSRTMGNGQAGVGAAHGPRHGRCEAGGTLLVNAAGRTVCDYSEGT